MFWRFERNFYIIIVGNKSGCLFLLIFFFCTYLFFHPKSDWNMYIYSDFYFYFWYFVNFIKKQILLTIFDIILLILIWRTSLIIAKNVLERSIIKFWYCFSFFFFFYFKINIWLISKSQNPAYSLDSSKQCI